MNYICKICNKEVLHSSHFWKEHRIKEKLYYEEHEPKFDLFTGEKLEFKNRDNYFFNDFTSRTNLKKYIQKLESEGNILKIGNLITDILLKRIKLKNILYSPSQVELRSLISPTIITYNKFFGDYYKLCDKLGLKNKHKDIALFNLLNPNQGVEIIIDTRENKPLLLKYKNITIGKLDFGDYGTNNGDIFIERKNLSDFIGTISSGHNRFIKEIERAKKENKYLFVFVESPINDALNFNYLPWINKNIKATPEFIFHRVRELIQNYPNIQFCFFNGRGETSEIIQLILNNQENFINFDIQLLYDTKILINMNKKDEISLS